MEKPLVTETPEIIAYRRKCNNEGENTGLSHYILMDNEPETNQEHSMKGGNDHRNN